MPHRVDTCRRKHKRTNTQTIKTEFLFSFTATDFIKTKFEVDGALIELQIW